MRFIITAQPGSSEKKADEDQAFDQNLFEAYMKFNEDMHKAAVLVASEGLLPGGGRARVEVKGGKRSLVDGPYAETKELVGGFYLIDVKSREEAIEWALRCPVGMGAADVLEIHQMTGPSDIPEELLAIILKVAPTWSAHFAKPR